MIHTFVMNGIRWSRASAVVGARKSCFKRTFWGQNVLKREEPNSEALGAKDAESSVSEDINKSSGGPSADWEPLASSEPTISVINPEKEIAELKDKYLRSVADFRNLQARTQREVADAKLFAIQQFAKDLINSVDNLERALATVPEDSRTNVEKSKELVDLYAGLKMTETILNKTLEKHGLIKYDGLGEKFNPNLHEAVYQASIPGKEAGTIFHNEQTGFILNGRVIRPAKVGVVKEH
ncbi:unnamed protein product [Pneumocystis jirovecii]|uniref:GrpE protein homolog n=2 Tax=Pneumocystis jirovecii TaxID=42068 RepID=L0P8K4_PNEJI|nr:uncharacterized protein T551_02817 [Pneumocystis jirovecii RU7]KTW27850.1 hypothetical protein T551_02817 [Pneumocystis jirovecii RU7]CCJ28399.1 unnamed protein product [Pneumocystis jirovecii]